MRENEKIAFISLGCAKNLVDSEHMLGLIKAAGVPITPDLKEAGTAVINTCGFIQDAVEETIDTVLECVKLKKEGRLKKIIVTGCFVQRYGYKLRKEIPEIDGWLGTGETYRIADIIEGKAGSGLAPFHIGKPVYLADHKVPRIRVTPFFTAYLRISEGCSHRCSFCMIPGLRGPLRSREIDSLITEAREMADNGVREINLVAQDTTAYGKDLEQGKSLEDLLEQLITIKGIDWIRLLYCHPDGLSDRLMELMSSEEKICPYIDLPLQHVNKEILKAMRRNHNRETPWETIERIRALKRRISIRTTLMVGFPGESEQIFAELYDFVKKARFDHLGVFAFSPEKGTTAARLKESVEPEIIFKRRDEIMSMQAAISRENNQRLVGMTIPVLIEGINTETDLLLNGRTATMAPEVDGRVLINKGRTDVGNIIPVHITEAHEYDLVGEIA